MSKHWRMLLRGHSGRHHPAGMTTVAIAHLLAGKQKERELR
jgi:hypothetical protein